VDLKTAKSQTDIKKTDGADNKWTNWTFEFGWIPGAGNCAATNCSQIFTNFANDASCELIHTIEAELKIVDTFKVAQIWELWLGLASIRSKTVVLLVLGFTILIHCQSQPPHSVSSRKLKRSVFLVELVAQQQQRR
jgi:hypothetical protein